MHLMDASDEIASGPTAPMHARTTTDAHMRAHAHACTYIPQVRDSTVAVSPFPISQLGLRQAIVKHSPHGLTNGLTCLTKRCVEWGGYNDKSMLIPREHLHAALGAPATEALDAKCCGHLRVGNSEQLLKKSLALHGVLSKHVTRVPPEMLPLVDSRCSPQGTCLVEEGKDCRPAQYTWRAPPCEALNASDAQRLLYAQRWVPRQELLPSLTQGIDLTSRRH